jgi:serine/threonine-protein kinase RsbW
MRVIEYGKDLESVIKFRVRELCQRRVDCIYLELPLSNPATSSLRNYGDAWFLFRWYHPEVQNGDVLRLQYFNNVDLELEDVHFASDLGAKCTGIFLRAAD